MASITPPSKYPEGHSVVLKSSAKSSVVPGYAPGTTKFTILRSIPRSAKIFKTISVGSGSGDLLLADPENKIINFKGNPNSINGLFNHASRGGKDEAGFLSKKQLTPNKFKLHQAEQTATSIFNSVKKQLNEMNLPESAKEVCITILENSNKGLVRFNPKIDKISPQDLGIITSDFGEITGCLFMLRKNSSKYSKAKFPESESEKLVDYYLLDKKGELQPVSAKSGAGGKPSITSILPVLEDLIKKKKLGAKYKQAVEVFKILAMEKNESNTKISSLYEGPLRAAQFLNTPGWNALVKILKTESLNTGYLSGIPTQEQLMAAVNNAGFYPDCMKFFQPLMDAANTKENSETTARLLNNPPSSETKKWGILHFPITSELVSWLNKDENNAKDMLTKAANLLNTTQIYLDSTKTEATYTVKEFSSAAFKFASASSIPRPTNNRIGFEMIKSPQKK